MNIICKPVGIIEVGMGGRLDSTNVLQPIATAVTNIDLEHTQYLGNTLEEIAFDSVREMLRRFLGRPG